jgi:hypothetical protein
VSKTVDYLQNVLLSYGHRGVKLLCENDLLIGRKEPHVMFKMQSTSRYQAALFPSVDFHRGINRFLTWI